jgi:hypothetical protein
MADERLDKLGRQVPGGQSQSHPPLHLWQPALSGDIDIVIHRDGRWSHENEPIRRESLVRLFASILRREADGEYYLVTPVEKWRIRVEGLPLQIVDFDIESRGTAKQCLVVTTNTGRRIRVSRDNPLYFPEEGEQGIPAVALPHGLDAQFSRAAWYRLAQVAEERDGAVGFQSDGLFYPIEPG